MKSTINESLWSVAWSFKSGNNLSQAMSKNGIRQTLGKESSLANDLYEFCLAHSSLDDFANHDLTIISTDFGIVAR